MLDLVLNVALLVLVLVLVVLSNRSDNDVGDNDVASSDGNEIQYSNADFDIAQDFIKTYYGVKVGHRSRHNVVDAITLQVRLDRKEKPVPVWKLYVCDIHVACSFKDTLAFRDGFLHFTLAF